MSIESSIDNSGGAPISATLPNREDDPQIYRTRQHGQSPPDLAAPNLGKGKFTKNHGIYPYHIRIQ